MSAVLRTSADLDALDFAKSAGIVTVVAQDATTGALLMVAFADRDALERTLATGDMHYRSRSRGLWRKGETSGHTQRVVTLTADCDGDAVLARVEQRGPACHTGEPTCFGIASMGPLTELANTIEARMTGTAGGPPSYTQRLLADRNLRLKKLGEECAELITALADADPARTAEEAADLVYHTLVAARAGGVTLADIERVLAARAGPRPDA